MAKVGEEQASPHNKEEEEEEEDDDEQEQKSQISKRKKKSRHSHESKVGSIDQKDRKKRKTTSQESSDEDNDDEGFRSKVNRAASETSSSSSNKQTQTADSFAKNFLELVKNRIQNTRPKLFFSFLGMMTEYRFGTVNLEELVDFVIEAFAEDDGDILQQFNDFLPPEYKITGSMIRRKTSRNSGNPPVMISGLLLTFVRSAYRKDERITSSFRNVLSRYRTTQDINHLEKDLESMFSKDPEFLSHLKKEIVMFNRPIVQ